MKKSFRIFFITAVSVLLAVISIFSAFSATIIEADGYILKVEDDDTTALSGFNGENLVVPQSVMSYYISSIEDYAFSGNKNLLSVDFSKSATLRKIGIMSFKDCTNISGTITIPSRVNNVGYAAFQGCSSVTSVELYPGMREVSEQLFYDCALLEDVFMASGFNSIGKLAFAQCPSLKTITIPANVTSIDSTAFYGDNNLVIKCNRNSYAEQYAKDNGISFEILDPLYGDANEDGDVNILDVTFIQKYKIGTKAFKSSYGEKCADVNKSGDVTIRDATLIQMKIAKIIENF